MSFHKKFSNGIKAVFQLGPSRICNFICYQVGLRSGYYRLRTPTVSLCQLLPENVFTPNWFMRLPDKGAFSQFGEAYQKQIINEADEIMDGRVRLFGGDPVPLAFYTHDETTHWTRFETGKVTQPAEDIKFTWEPARFGWAIILGKAYFFTNDTRYADTFWKFLEAFNNNNPLNKGPNWQSGQEVALRLIALVISQHLFKSGKSRDGVQKNAILVQIVDHAERIMPTLAYAKAQDNNHLLAEAAGLYTAGVFLAHHPKARKWKKTGNKLFNQAIQNQIDQNGEYIQHSTNYQRLMLMLSLWMQYLLDSEGRELEDVTGKKLASAAAWLAGQMDYPSGKVPNLGHNDGSLILPFSNAIYSDYRPVIQAASRAFLAKAMLPSGSWDDLCLWLDLPVTPVLPESIDIKRHWPENRLGTLESWASLRAVHYSSRPAHADQLHVEIWHKGVNITCDAGTYLYNAAPPWDNKLATTKVHNTIVVNKLDQMTRAGRFLWLDWAQAKTVKNNPNSVTGIQNGYLKSGILHKRKLECQPNNGWLVTDNLIQLSNKNIKRTILINWLLPDWSYDLQDNSILLSAPFGYIKMELFTRAGVLSDGFNILKAGKSMLDKEDSVNHGWYSPTYRIKLPALSIQYTTTSLMPIEITTRFSFVG